MTTIAVMQPYFFPYAGYFRLFAGCDVFALFDCVQFPRRGWVHRNRLIDANDNLSWLTLPLRKSARETKICELRFSDNAAATFQKQWARFPDLSKAKPNSDLMQLLRSVEGPVVDYLDKTLRYSCKILDLPYNVVRTSSLELDPEIKGQERIIEVVKRLNGDQYINLQGGSALYDPDAFAAENIALNLLPDFTGDMASILQRLLTEPVDLIHREIVSQLTLSR